MNAVLNYRQSAGGGPVFFGSRCIYPCITHNEQYVSECRRSTCSGVHITGVHEETLRWPTHSHLSRNSVADLVHIHQDIGQCVTNFHRVDYKMSPVNIRDVRETDTVWIRFFFKRNRAKI